MKYVSFFGSIRLTSLGRLATAIRKRFALQVPVLLVMAMFGVPLQTTNPELANSEGVAGTGGIVSHRREAAAKDSIAEGVEAGQKTRSTIARKGLLPIQNRILDMLEAQHSRPVYRAACFAPGTPESVMRAWYAQAFVPPPGAAPFRPNARWTTTATDGSGISRGQPITLTWGILADGASTDTSDPSNLRAFLNAIYGSQATWQPLMQEVFDRWRELTGISYVFEPNDDGAAFPGSPGILGVRADVRIGGHNIDGPFNTLAYNFFPNSGDMIIDTQDTIYNNTGNDSLIFRNIFSHEHGHGIGLAHTCPGNATKLMEPSLATAFDGPQHDDILSANRNYGDRFGLNNSTGTATDLGTLPDGDNITTNLSIVTQSDVDYYAFRTSGGSRRATVTMTPVGFTYLEAAQNQDGSCPAGTSFNSLTLRNLGLEIIDANGTTVIANAAAAAAGEAEVLTDIQLGGSSGPFYVRVFGDGTDQVQMYNLAISLVDGTPQPEVAIIGNGIEITDGDTTPSAADDTDFGQQELGGSPITKTYVITNTGFADLTLTLPISLSGVESAEYSVTQPAASTLAAGAGTTFAISLNGSAAGVKGATVTLNNNDVGEGVYTFDITGVVVSTPVIEVIGNNNNIPNGSSPASAANGTDFGSVNISNASKTNVFTINNTGTTNLVITTPITIGGTHAGDFTVLTNPAANVAPGTGTTFAVAFDASAIGTRNALLQILNNDADETPYTFEIAGTGATLPVAGVLGGNGQPIINGDTSPSTADGTDFGGADILAGTSVRIFSVTNQGTADLNLSLPIVITGTSAAEYSVTANPPTSIAPGAVGNFSVTFNPATAGPRRATVQINNNDGNNTPFEFDVQGIGTREPEIALTGNGLEILNGSTTTAIANGTDFGTAIRLLETVTRTFVITNGGSSNVTLNLPVDISGPGAADFSVSMSPNANIASQGASILEISFTPSISGARAATVTIGNNDPDENPYTFNISGTGSEAEIAVLSSGRIIADGDVTPSPTDNTDFGSHDVTTGSASRTFVITNSGDAVLTVTLPVVFTGPAGTDYSLTSLSSASIPPGGTANLEILFNPSGTGARDATVAITNSDANENPYNFAVTGIGTGPDIEVFGNGFVILDGATNATTTNLTAFGTNFVGANSTNHTFVITNAGTGTLNLSLPVVVGAGDTNDFQISRQPGTNSLAAGRATTFDVVFSARSGGPRRATLLIESGDSDENPFDFAVTGIGLGPEIAVIGNGLIVTNGDVTPTIEDGTAFGGADLNSGFVIRQFTITNSGIDTLQLQLPITFTGTAAADFTLETSPPAAIGPGQSRSFQVRFDPNGAGTRSAFMTINSLDFDENPYVIGIEGVGIVIPPTITTHPVSKNLNALEDTSLFVGANGTVPLTYRWYKDGVIIPGANSPTLVLNDVTTANAGAYTASISNVAGVVTSSAASVTVNLLPTVVSWNNPADIAYGTALSPAQMNAVASVPGTFAYSPGIGAVLTVGNHAMNAVFTPSNPQVYQGGAANVTINVTRAPLSIRADDKTMLVGATVPALTFTATGFVNNDTSASLSPAPNLVTTATSASPLGNYPITVSGAANPNYNISYVDGNMLVFSASPIVQTDPVGQTVDALTDVTLTVVATGEEPLTYVWKKGTANVPGAPNSPTLTLSNVTPNDAGNYTVEVSNAHGSVTSSGAQLTVNKLDPVITWANPANIVYGTALDANQLSATANVPGTIAYSPDTGVVLAAGSRTLNATFTPTDTLNYNVANPTVPLTVGNATLTIGVQNASREYGMANPTFNITYTGFVNGDDAGDLTTPPTASSAADAASVPGNYPITVSGAAGPNYDFNYAPGTLTVFANLPSITDQPDSLSVTVGNAAAFAVTATGTTPLSYQWRHAGTNLPAATAASLNIGSTGVEDAGEYDVVVSNVGGSITSFVANLTVLIPPSIVVQPASVAVDAGGIASFTVVGAGSLPLAYQWKKGASELPSQTNATLLVSNLSTNDNGDYSVVVSNAAGSITSATATLTVNRLTPTVNWATPAAINYGTAIGENQLNAVANVPGGFVYSPASGSVPAGGNQPLSVVFTPIDTGRYAPVTVNRTITVNPVALTVTANNATREVGQANPTFTVTYAGFVNGDTPANLATQPTASSAANGSSPIGTYSIVPSGGFSPNYTFTYVAGTLTVVAVPVNITTHPVSQVVTQDHNATLVVVATGSPTITYQWRRHGTNLIGQVGPALTIVGAQAADDAPYDVIVSNPAGSVTSSVAQVDVLLPSIITWAQPANITYGTPVGGTQQNAAASIPGTITYGQTAGSVLPAGTQQLTLSFVPTDTAVYLPTNATVNLTVDQANLSITADNKAREFGAANPTLTVAFAGFVNGENPTALTTQPMVATAADGASLPGSYPITVSGAAAANYNISHVAGSLTVFANPPVVTAPPVSLTVTNGDPVSFMGTVSGTAPLTYQWQKDGADISGATSTSYNIGAVTTGDAGVYTLIATNVGGTVTSAGATLTVLVPPAITVQPVSQAFSALSDVTFGVTATGTGPLAYQWLHNGQPISNGTNRTLTLTAVTPAQVGAYSVRVSNLAATVDSATATLSVSPLAPDITWPTPNAITYGSPLSGIQLNASTFIPGSFVYNPALSTILNSGTHTLNVTFNPTDITNFVSTNASVQLTVNKAPLQVVADNQSREFNTANPSLTITYNGFVNGDDAGDLTATPTASTTAVVGSPPGNYPITVSGAAATNYDVTHTDGNLTVFANAPTIVTHPADAVVTSGFDTAFTVLANGTAPLTYQWRHQGTNLPNQTNATLNVTNVNPQIHAGAYDVVLTNIAGGRTSLVGTLTVLVAPGITQQPLDVTASAQGVAGFSITATGTAPLAYQWRRDGIILLNQTNAALSIASVRTNDAGAYTVTVSNGAGSITSDVANLSVNQLSPNLTWTTPPPITYGTALDGSQLNAMAGTPGAFAYSPTTGTVLTAGSHTLSVTFAPSNTADYVSSNLSVTIQVNPAVLTVRADDKSREFGQANPGLTASFSGFVNGEDSSVITQQPTLGTSADAASGLGGYPITASGTIAPNYAANHVAGTLTVFGNSPVIVSHPSGVTTVAGTNVSFTNVATGTTPLFYQWRKAGASLAGATNAVLTLTNVVQLDSGGYDVVVSNVAGVAVSFPAVLNVLVAPQFVQTPTNTTVSVGQPATLVSAAVGTAPITYQWYREGAPILNATNATLSFASPGTNDTAGYVLVASNIAGSATNNSVMLTVVQTPVITQIPGSATFNAGSTILIPAQAYGEGTLHYTWRRGTNVIRSGPSISTLSIPNAGLNHVGIYDLTVTNAFGTTRSQSLLVTLSGPPQIVTHPADVAVQPDAAVEFAVISSGSQPLQYAWLRDGAPVPGGNQRTLLVTNVLANAGNYSVAVANAFGVVVSRTASLSVIGVPLISVSPTNRVVPVGTNVDLSVVAQSAVPPAYQWRKEGVVLTNATNSTLSIGNIQVVQGGNYDVIVSNPNGSATSAVAQVTVLLPPSISAQPVGQTVTVGQPVLLSAQALGGVPLSYQWMRNGVEIPGATGNSLSLTNVSRISEGSYALRVSNPVGTAFSQNALLRVLAPQVLTNASGGRSERFRMVFGDQDGNQLSLTDAGRFVIEGSSDLINWTVVSTNGAGLIYTNGQFRFEDLSSVIEPRRFYRVREQ